VKSIRINDILDKIEEGVFLLNKDLKIGRTYSRALEKIFDDKNFASQNFLTYLEKRIPKKLVKETSEYLELLISGRHDAELLTELNPLHRCKFTFTENNSVNMIEKYLDFKFELIENTKSENQIIAIVKDVTKNERVVQQLSAAESKTQQQLEWIINLIHVDSDLLNDFMKAFQQEMINIQTLFRKSENKKNYPHILKNLYHPMHIIKQRAGLLDLNLFVKMIHEFENEIALLINKEEISGNDFVSLVLKLQQMQNIYDEIKQLLDKLSKIHNQLRPKRSYENKMLIDSLTSLVNNLMKEYGKEIRLEDTKFYPNNIPFRYRLITKEILIQLIRNAVIYGIEHPDERKKRKKKPLGQLLLKTNINKKFYKFSLRDDGRGMQINVSQKKAMSSKKISKAETNNLNKRQSTNTIYLTGSKIPKSVDMSAGRFTGMDILKKKVDQLNGQIKIKYLQNKFCEFEISLPID